MYSFLFCIRTKNSVSHQSILKFEHRTFNLHLNAPPEVTKLLLMNEQKRKSHAIRQGCICPSHCVYSYFECVHCAVCSVHCVCLGRLNIIGIKNLQFTRDIICFVAQQFNLFLIGFQHNEVILDFTQFIGHIGGGTVHDSAQTGKCTGEFSAKRKKKKAKLDSGGLCEWDSRGDLLLHLVAAVGRRQINDQLQFSGRMLNVLVLEGLLFGGIGPRYTFVEVDTAVESTNADQHAPTDGFQQLKIEQKIHKNQEISSIIIFTCKYVVELTKPATSRPPTVPCDPIDAIANREMRDI